jgi:hypothetical protein
MKTIKDGLRYDTEKAILIGEASSDLSRTDFGWWEAGLYCTPRSGRYFLAGRGGPMTRWARPAGNMTTGGNGIIPLDEEDALEWAEQYLTHDEIEAAFGEKLEDA